MIINVNESNIPKCKYCKDCNQIGRQQSTVNYYGRKRYWCNNKISKNYPLKKFGNRAKCFISFGDITNESPITIKTSPRWCPKRLTNKL